MEYKSVLPFCPKGGDGGDTTNHSSPLLRQDGESDYDYHKRLIFGKLVDKTLADYDYSELASYVYGRDYSTDVARRMMYGSRFTLDLIGEGQLAQLANPCDDISRRLEELQKERQRFFDQRREYNKGITNTARYEHLINRIVEATESLSKTVGNVYDCRQITNTYDDNGLCNGPEAVLVFSDWHYGLNTQNAFNVYNIEICRQRVRNVVESAAHRILLHNCSKLHIIILGDLFHGAIHTSARVASEELVCDQIMQVSEILAQSIEFFIGCVPSITVYATYGNHGRTIPKKEENVHRDNIERLVPWWLRQRLRGHQSITVCEDIGGDEFIVTQVAGHDFCATHGDLDSVERSTKLLPQLLNKRYGVNIEYILLGDRHHRESIEELGVTTMLCGALCGTDDYANEKRLYATPSQLLLIVNKDVGVDAEYRIKC